MQVLVKSQECFSNGLPCNLARNSQYNNAFVFPCKNNLSGYAPKEYNDILSKLLQKKISNILKNYLTYKRNRKRKVSEIDM